jgi:hypothetical protein
MPDGIGVLAAAAALGGAGYFIFHQWKTQRDAWLRTPEGIAWRRQREEPAARAKWNFYHASKSMEEISRMSGLEFEGFLAKLLSRMGYKDIDFTPAVNDQGADIICVSPEGERIAIQAKRWKGAVGNGAVQQVNGAKGHYRCTQAWVITNSSFTRAARELAQSNSILLLGGHWLEEQIRIFLPRDIPEFDWDEYDRILRPWNPTWERAFAAERGKTRTAIRAYDYLLEFQTAKKLRLTEDQLARISELQKRPWLTDEERAQVDKLQEKIAALHRGLDQAAGKLPPR